MNSKLTFKRLLLAVTAVTIAGTAIVFWNNLDLQDQEATRSTDKRHLKQLALSTLQYRDNAPPLLIRTSPNGTKDYYWLVEGQEIYKRREIPKKQ